MTGVRSETTPLIERAAAFVNYLEDWLKNRPALPLADIIEDAGEPARVAIVSVDLIVGFCHDGPLSSPRVAGILPAVRALFERAHAAGMTRFILPQDTHRPDAEEFASYPPHCIAGTAESTTVSELASLPFADSFTIIEKNSISSIIEPDFAEWESEYGPFATYLVIGDCTDLCVYQAAMALKLRSTSRHLGQRVIVPVDCVETYDIPVEIAGSIGAEPHDGDLLHHVFLHSMSQSGVEIVATVS